MATGKRRAATVAKSMLDSGMIRKVDWVVGVQVDNCVGMDVEEWFEYWYRRQKALEWSNDEKV